MPLEILGSAPSSDPPSETFRVTEAAWQAVPKLLRDRGAPDSKGLRVGVRGGGCSGFEYVLEPEDLPKNGDTILDGPGELRVFIDPKSLKILAGTVLDYDKGLMSAGFRFKNPAAKSTCSCGSSFSM